MTGAADVDERLDRQHRIDADATDAALQSRVLELPREVCAFKSFGVLALPICDRIAQDRYQDRAVAPDQGFLSTTDYDRQFACTMIAL
jgi:hypothetical protein